MKPLNLIILTFLFISCSVTNDLNRKIDCSQRKSLKNSPFKTAKGLKTELKKQKINRLEYEADLRLLIEKNPNDTIILTEAYDFICFGCPSNFVQVFAKNELLLYRKHEPNMKYQRFRKLLTDNFVDSTGYFYTDIYELRQEIKKGKKWNMHPEKYGTDECHDGSHTFYTVFYPSGKIESMYMRCWSPKEYRNKE